MQVTRIINNDHLGELISIHHSAHFYPIAVMIVTISFIFGGVILIIDGHTINGITIVLINLIILLTYLLYTYTKKLYLYKNGYIISSIISNRILLFPEIYSATVIRSIGLKNNYDTVSITFYKENDFVGNKINLNWNKKKQLVDYLFVKLDEYNINHITYHIGN